MALWGGRFAEGTDKRLQKFTESISFDKRLYKYDIEGSKAYVSMLSHCKLIPEKSANRIKETLDKILMRIEKGDFVFSEELEDIHMHIEDALIKELGEEGGRLHAGRSRNDQVVLDIRLFLRDEIDEITDYVRNFQKALVKQAEKFKEIIFPGYTHLQHAQPVLFAHHLLAYVEMLQRDIERLKDCYKRINILPLGSGALAGTTLPIDRQKLAELLNFPKISRNSMDAVADRDFICEFIGCLSILSMHISRLSEDIILWVSQEFEFIKLPDAFCTGSSLMPQKKNPDIAELTRGKTGRVYGNLINILTVCKGLPLTYNRDLQEDKEPLFDSIDTIKKILSVFPEMVELMEPNIQAMKNSVSDPELMATDLAEQLVRYGVPFRIAHKRVGAFVRWCKENNKKMNNVTLQEMQITIPEAKNECLSVFCPEKSVAKREIPGATGPNEVKKQIEFWKKELNI